jgi:hypothetical protein
MIENFRTHPYTRAVCLETARLFERRAAENLVAAQFQADEGLLGEAQRLQARAKLAQQRASAWRLRAQNARNGLTVVKGETAPIQIGAESHGRLSAKPGLTANATIAGNRSKQATAKPGERISARREYGDQLRAGHF